jgi:hypothetical protein
MRLHMLAALLGGPAIAGAVLLGGWYQGRGLSRGFQIYVRYLAVFFAGAWYLAIGHEWLGRVTHEPQIVWFLGAIWAALLIWHVNRRIS